MEYEQTIINQIINNFDFAFMLTTNALTYFIIKVIDEINKEKVITTWQKRIVLVAIIAILTIIYAFTGYERWTVLINSACAAPVFWSWVLKPIINKIGINYKKDINK